MPIDYKRYHPKWTLIGRLIRRRAAYRCEVCRVPDKAVGYWIDDRFWTLLELENLLDKTGKDLLAKVPGTKKPWPIVLTVAHLDHDITNNRFWNLKAMCQPHHLAHDRVDNAQRRKYGPKGQYFKQLTISYEPATQ